MAQVALSKDFLEAYSRLPKTQQKKVREFTEKFRRDPTSSGVNFEKINDAVDSKVRSVRIDQAYRAIVVHPPKGDVYLCVWVDHHDDAYQWVRNRRFEVNPSSGAMQIYDVGEAVEKAAEPVPAPEAPAGLFESFGDEDLLLAGVPGPLLPAVRAVRTEGGLDRLGPHLPEEAAEVLLLMAAGYPLMESLDETERARETTDDVDVQDFQAALETPEAQRQFKVVESEDDLDDALNAPLDRWRIFLHPTQRKLVKTKANGPMRVLGGAGTGKTVVLMHRARHLARDVFTSDDDRLLVTTFTRNLALDLDTNIKNLCGPEYARLEIVNLHAWAARFMRRQGVEFKVVPDHDKRELWELAIAESGDPERPESFYREEWERVVQPQDVASRDDYFKARRVGRGTRLGRKQRADVWRVLSRYRELLDEGKWVEWEDVIRETRLYIDKQGVALPYRAVLADEVQDFSPNDLKLIRALVKPGKSDLFLVGDGHQRIYAHETRLGRCGIEIRGRSRRLKLNYRTTEEIRNYAVGILEGLEIDDLDEGMDTLKGYKSLRRGVRPEVEIFAKEAQEAAFIRNTLGEWLKEVAPSDICVAARKKAQLRERYAPMLEAVGIDATIVEGEPVTGKAGDGVRLATMHRMKGLEFKRVILAGVQENSAFKGGADDTDVDEARLLRERCLLYVASTRARDRLMVTGYGEAGPIVRGE